MLSLRNLYRAFHESRSDARRVATLAVTGDAPHAATLATLLDATTHTRGAEVLLSVTKTPDGPRISISGEAIEEASEVSLPALDEEAVRRRLAPRLAAAVRDGFLVPLGRGYPALRRAASERIIRRNARQNAFIGFLPIPGADMPAITANQARMVLGTAAIHGEEISLERARELLGVLAAGLGLRALARQVVKLVPVAGWAASATIGYAGTLAMGRAAILYFERGKKSPEPEELQGIRHRALQEAREYVKRVRRR